MFRGSMVAIITPFAEDGRFDEEKYRELIEFQIEKRHRCHRPLRAPPENPQPSVTRNMTKLSGPASSRLKKTGSGPGRHRLQLYPGSH